MKIHGVNATVHDLAGSVEFYRDTLDTPVDESTDRAVVHAGSSRLTLTPGQRFDGVHHEAFGIMPEEFEQAHTWLSERVSLLVADGSEVIVGATGWNSRSVYFLGPEDIILELIARDTDTDTDTAKRGKPADPVDQRNRHRRTRCASNGETTRPGAGPVAV